MNKNTTKKFALGTLFAAAAGYLAGLLTAPKSGKETRQDIKDTTGKAIAEVEKQLKHIHTQLGDSLETAKNHLSKATGKGREELESAMDVAKKAKDKVRSVLSAVHEGDAEDKDLHQAVTEASKALDHLKTFLKS